MIHQSMRNYSRMADELYIHRVFLALEDFFSFSLDSFSCIAKQATALKNSFDFCACLDTRNRHFERLVFSL